MRERVLLSGGLTTTFCVYNDMSFNNVLPRPNRENKSVKIIPFRKTQCHKSTDAHYLYTES